MNFSLRKDTLRDFPMDLGYYNFEVIAMANVGKNIRNMRTENKMTQDELAEKLFVSRQTISNYETGKSNPDIDMLVKIAEVLNTDVNILIFGIPTPPAKKREYLKLIIIASITLLLGIFMGIAGPWLRVYTADTFHTGLTLAYQASVYPLFFLCAGWCIMQASGTFLGAKPLAGLIPRILHYFIILLLIVYGIAVLPYCIMEVQYAIKLSQWLNAGVSDTFQTAVSEGGFREIAWNLFSVVCYFRIKYSLIYTFSFFLSGVILWGTKSQKPADKVAAPPSPDTPR